MKTAMTVNEAAEYTKIGRNTIRQLIKWKKLPVLRIGRKIIIRQETLEDFLKINEETDLRDKNEVKPAK